MNAITPARHAQIQDKIARIGSERNVAIMLAVESGSRAWGFASTYHYLNMAKGNFREYLQGENVKLKKYFYVLRPILACAWIHAHNEPPPMEFDRLLATIDDPSLLREIQALLHRKKSGDELKQGRKIASINRFLEEQIGAFEQIASRYDPGSKPHPEFLDRLLWTIVTEPLPASSCPAGQG